MNVNFTDFKQFNLVNVFRLNADATIQDSMIDGMPYVIIDDIFENPAGVIEFLKCFPADTYTSDVQSVYDDGVRSVDDLQDSNLQMRPAGLQQKIMSEIIIDLSFNLYKFLVEQDFIAPHELMYEDHFSPIHVQNELSAFNFNTQLYYPGMLSVGGNNNPTVDRFEYMFKIFLSDNIEGGDINFYKVNSCDKYWSSINQIMNESTDEEKYKISQDLNNATSGRDIDVYKPRCDETVFEKFHTIEHRFNRLILHPGAYFYSVDYDATKETNCRFSLETGFNDYSKMRKYEDE